MKQFIGSILALAGLSLYILHVLTLSGPPHFLWVIAGTAILLTGMWLVFTPPAEKKP